LTFVAFHRDNSLEWFADPLVTAGKIGGSATSRMRPSGSSERVMSPAARITRSVSAASTERTQRQARERSFVRDRWLGLLARDARLAGVHDPVRAHQPNGSAQEASAPERPAEPSAPASAASARIGIHHVSTIKMLTSWHMDTLGWPGESLQKQLAQDPRNGQADQIISLACNFHDKLAHFRSDPEPRCPRLRARTS